MAPKLISEFTLNINMETFIYLFWNDSKWYERFLSEYLEDISINVGQWEYDSESTKIRQITSYHPSKVSFPGLPSHAESLKTQIMEYIEKSNELKFNLKESNTLRGIPYADYFTVDTEWIVTSSHNSQECFISIYLEVVFLKSTWLQSTIESNTKAELIVVYEKWLEFAMKQIKVIQQQSQIRKAKSHDSDLNMPTVAIKPIAIPLNMNNDSLSSDSRDMNINEDRSIRELISYVSDNVITLSSHSNDSDDYGSDDDLLFYDCEEGTYTATGNNKSSINSPGNLHSLYYIYQGNLTIHFASNNHRKCNFRFSAIYSSSDIERSLW